MRSFWFAGLVACLAVNRAPAQGMLLPVEKGIAPLAIVNHQVEITIQDQVATTRLEQTFRNSSGRALEATYLFPIPAGASVRRFSMWINGRETAGELLEADRARQIYFDVVRRIQDPGLLEYVGSGMLRLRVFPVPPHGDQKIAVTFSSVAQRDQNVVEYVYPLKTSGNATHALEKFSIVTTLKSQHPISSVYSPSHAIAVSRPNDREAVVRFEQNQAPVNKDFQLFYAVSDQDVGLTALPYRSAGAASGYCMLLLSPRVEVTKIAAVPRDMVFVLDTSGSMAGVKLEQAKKALHLGIGQLRPNDRFGLLNFSTTVNRYSSGLVASTPEQIEQAKQWVDRLEAVGGTAINEALLTALDLRPPDPGRIFTVLFFTDGMPTVGENNPERILQNVGAKNSASTRIFTVGVGDDVNATLLDRLAEQTRGVCTYVRPAEDIEAKVSTLYAKIGHPVLSGLQLTSSGGIQLQEVYPPQLPDLFHGGQLIVLARYNGAGAGTIKLAGNVNGERRELVYPVTFPKRSGEDTAFVEPIWARRKAGYLIDQIRAHGPGAYGSTKELVDELMRLAKQYGIATPYTSYLIVPDAPIPVVGAGSRPLTRRPELVAGRSQASLESQLKSAALSPERLESRRDGVMDKIADQNSPSPAENERVKDVTKRKETYDQAARYLSKRQQRAVQEGKLGVDLSVESSKLRSQDRLAPTAVRQAAGRSCLEVDGVWIDSAFLASMPTLAIKAQSDAYFRILERQPQMRELFQLGNYLVWVSPSGTALVVDAEQGKVADAEVDGFRGSRKK